ncbi:hypothetical protein CBW53_03115 [Yersinia frederiksenii]|nr:hypothetical protein CBW53_03115 [Yersinia frederiksenii]
MKRSDVYSAITEWIESHGFDAGYTIQRREWTDGKADERFIVIMASNNVSTEEAIIKDNFRIIVISKKNESDLNSVEDLADNIRQKMISNYSFKYITQMKPIGSLYPIRTKENRWLIEINFQATISR